MGYSSFFVKIAKHAVMHHRVLEARYHLVETD